MGHTQACYFVLRCIMSSSLEKMLRLVSCGWRLKKKSLQLDLKTRRFTEFNWKGSPYVRTVTEVFVSNFKLKPVI